MIGEEHDAEKRILGDIERVRRNHQANRRELGRLFRDLQNLYSERNSGGMRLTSGHGQFEAKIKELGFKPRRVREWICDFEVSEGLRKPDESTAAKRRTRRSNSDEYRRGYQAAMKDEATASRYKAEDPVSRFASLLTFHALKTAYRSALQELHPDHGGDGERAAELIRAWEAVEQLHASTPTDFTDSSEVTLQ